MGTGPQQQHLEPSSRTVQRGYPAAFRYVGHWLIGPSVERLRQEVLVSETGSFGSVGNTCWNCLARVRIECEPLEEDWGVSRAAWGEPGGVGGWREGLVLAEAGAAT